MVSLLAWRGGAAVRCAVHPALYASCNVYALRQCVSIYAAMASGVEALVFPHGTRDGRLWLLAVSLFGEFIQGETSLWLRSKPQAAHSKGQPPSAFLRLIQPPAGTHLQRWGRSRARSRRTLGQVSPAAAAAAAGRAQTPDAARPTIPAVPCEHI